MKQLRTVDLILCRSDMSIQCSVDIALRGQKHEMSLYLCCPLKVVGVKGCCFFMRIIMKRSRSLKPATQTSKELNRRPSKANGLTVSSRVRPGLSFKFTFTLSVIK